jgi:hypothetical protein
MGFDPIRMQSAGVVCGARGLLVSHRALHPALTRAVQCGWLMARRTGANLAGFGAIRSNSKKAVTCPRPSNDVCGLLTPETDGAKPPNVRIAAKC